MLFALASLCLALAGEPTAPPTIEPGHLYDRIAIVGASASDGFGVIVKEEKSDTNPRPAAVHLNMTKVLRHAAEAHAVGSASATGAAPATGDDAPAPIIHHYASGLFFASPGTVGRGEIDRALKSKVTLVIALDYLFWFVYGTVTADGKPMTEEAERVANLESGLAQLDRLLAEGVPVVTGTIPDVRDSIGKMLSKAQVPDPATIVAANARIAEWVAARPGVRLVPLADILVTLKTGEPVSLGGTSWDPAKWGAMLQGDQLHPTFCGTVALAAGIMMTAAEFDPSSPSPWTLDPEAIKQCAIAAEKKKPGATSAPNEPSPSPPTKVIPPQ